MLDEQDRTVYAKRLPNDLAAILAALRACAGMLRGVAVESTFNWYWLVDGLQAAGFTVHLVNTAAVKQYDGLKHGGDFSDARNLGARASCNEVKRWEAKCIDAMELLDEQKQAVKANLAVMNCIDDQVVQLERHILSKVKLREDFKGLKTVSGIGEILALTIALETGDISRFGDPGNFASYASMVDSRRESNGKKKGVGNTKCGNKHLAWAFIEAAHFAVRFDATIKRWYQKKCASSLSVVAIKAVAHKLAHACYVSGQ